MSKHFTTLALLGITALASAVFVLFPQLDIAVSHWFYDGAGFPLEHAGLAVFLRWAYMIDVTAFVLAMVGFLAMGLLIGKSRKVPLRLSAYPILVFLLGPLLLVNSVLKANWGRARPANIVEFGGDSSFSPAIWISEQCAANCSFTSGEGAAIATVAILLAVLIWPMLNKRWRGITVLALSGWAILGMGLRVAGGRHFLSDTVLSLLFCALIARLIYVLMNMQKVAPAFTLANLGHDWAALRRRFSKTAPEHDDPPPDQAG